MNHHCRTSLNGVVPSASFNRRQLLVLLLTFHWQISLTSSQTSSQNYPNPAQSPQKCGLQRKGFVCDPDEILTTSDRNALSDYLKDNVYRYTQMKKSKDKARFPCMVKGLTVVVAFVKKIPSSGEKASNSEMVRWLEDLQRRWQLDPECKRDVIIGFSSDDRKLKVLSIPEYTGVTGREIDAQFNKVKGLIQQNKVRDAIQSMASGFVQEYISSDQLYDPKTNLPFGRNGGGQQSSNNNNGRGNQGSGGGGGEAINPKYQSKGQDFSKYLKKLKNFKAPKFPWYGILLIVILIAMCCCCCCLCLCCSQLRQCCCPCLTNKEDGTSKLPVGGNFNLPEGIGQKIPTNVFKGFMGGGGGGGGRGASYAVDGGNGGDGGVGINGFGAGGHNPEPMKPIPPPAYSSGGGDWGPASDDANANNKKQGGGGGPASGGGDW